MSKRLGCGIAPAALIAVILALAIWPQHAHAVTLMVNGDTPARHWQRVANNLMVPVFDGVIDLYSEQCPQLRRDAGVVGCFVPGRRGRPPRIYLTPGQWQTGRTLAHELGHAYAWQTHRSMSEPYADTYAYCGRTGRITVRAARTIGWSYYRAQGACQRLKRRAIRELGLDPP